MSDPRTFARIGLGGRRGRLALLVLIGTAGLAACGNPHEELQAWMDQQRREAKPRVSPLLPPRRTWGPRWWTPSAPRSCRSR
jgi:type IV pilus assembly protein PilP